MMKQINERAKNLSLKQLSLLAFEQNPDAIRLYERLGFGITDRLAVITHPLIQYTGDVVLMVADVLNESENLVHDINFL
jgi:ribosomal protein S18 acetylase RimI-like enzyme